MLSAMHKRGYQGSSITLPFVVFEVQRHGEGADHLQGILENEPNHISSSVLLPGRHSIRPGANISTW